MRLSDAIALGRVTIENPEKCQIANCALGMAANAAGIPVSYDAVNNTWPFLLKPPAKSPCGHVISRDMLLDCLTHLFDYHVMSVKDWNLDQLIDWVRSVEPTADAETINTSAPMTLTVNMDGAQ